MALDHTIVLIGFTRGVSVPEDDRAGTSGRRDYREAVVVVP